ncbi:hypothetical protein ACFWY5_23720 [Nonomuraea sp. NPDC059007]|uniref:hypothetical protein n=1 Tax=Nonomuraea sp. NPDC059007 TaxID=3346692 RepID=UPI0036A34229
MLAALAVLTIPVVATAAQAHDDADTPILGIVRANDYFSPSGPNDQRYNGHKVFLSSPRHNDSGDRGECRNPGYEENVNGRQFNWRAANGNFIGRAYRPTYSTRNLHGRGYQVAVSKNTRDNGHLNNRTRSRNWGSDVHIITHTNATTGCNASASYLLTMYQHTNDRGLATALGRALDPAVPSNFRQSRRPDLAELRTNAPRGDAYVELQFHDNQTTQKWIHSESVFAAWRYGIGVDRHLNYP